LSVSGSFILLQNSIGTGAVFCTSINFFLKPDPFFCVTRKTIRLQGTTVLGCQVERFELYFKTSFVVCLIATMKQT